VLVPSRKLGNLVVLGGINRVTVHSTRFNMRFATRFLLHTAVAILACALVACGSSNNAPTSANVRLVNATSNASLTLSINGAAYSPSQAPRSISPYASLAAASYTVNVASATASPAAFSETWSFASAQSYTMVAYERSGVLYGSMLIDNLTAPASGQTTLVITNASLDAGSLDVYVVASGTTSIIGLLPTFSAVFPLASSGASTMTSGTYNVIVTGANNQSDVRFQGQVSLVSAQADVLALSGTGGGALVNAALIVQGGSATFLQTAFARARLVSVLPQNPPSAVMATVGSTPLGPVYAPIVGNYTAVAGGSAVSGITVAGTAVTIPANIASQVLATGTDSTILLYGTASPWSVALFSDTNLSAGGQADVRVVNVANPAADGVTLYINNVTVATNVLYGTASAYAPVVPSSNPPFLFIGGGISRTTNPSNLVTGSVYTVFVYDAALDAIVHLDR